jgi:hypothetical protein
MKKNATAWRSFIIMLICILFFTACKKDNPVPDDETPVLKKATYTIEGNYSGKVSIVFYNESGTAITETFVSLPWKKEFTTTVSTTYLGLNINTSSTSTLGKPGEKALCKILLDNTEMKSVEAVADKDGHITTGTVMYYF